MKTSIPFGCMLRVQVGLIAVALIGLVLTPRVRAQSGTGTIEGRVLNSTNGEYLSNARITVEGTTLEAFTDSDGFYRLTNVPAGTAKVRAFFTGLAVLSTEVPVASGQAVVRDFTLASATGQEGVVKLSNFVVGASREMDGSAIAINEQRFAANIKNVISSDEFGGVAEGNVAEVLKFMPGVTVDTSGGNMRFISINGVSSDNVPVTIDGFNLASAAGTATNRSVQVDMVSINNLSRVEVTYSPTPESPGAALAGTVNMIPRSSFERTKPVFNGSVYIMMRDNARDFEKVPGPKARPTRNVHPGFDFSYVAPVNQRFGFTLSGGHSQQYSPQDITTLTWRGGGTATNGTTFPHTTPDRPYLSSYAVLDGPKVTARNSIGGTIDFKLTPYDRIAFALQYSSFEVHFRNTTLTYNIGGVLPGNFSVTSVRGATGAGDVVIDRAFRHRFNETIMPTLTWRHDGPVWKASGGAGMSHATDQNLSTSKGFLRTTVARRAGVTVSFDDIFYLRPRIITVTDGTTGVPVDPYNLSNYTLASGANAQDGSTDVQRSAYGNLQRSFYGRVPVTLKGGLQISQAMRDIRSATPAFTFVGADGRAGTADDNAAQFRDAGSSSRVPPYGLPPIGVLNNNQLLDHLRLNPSHFQWDANSEYRSTVSNSKHAEEIISAGYLRGDASFFERRLKLIGGVRAEQTNIKAEGPLTDQTRNFQRNASGQIIRGANGAPLTILPATDALGVSRLTFIDRGTQSDKEYLRLFPNLNAGYNLRENLIARAAYYQSIGRPDFNQYAGGVTLPNTDSPPSANNRITVNNAGIKPWTAKTVNVRLEYYFGGVGQISLGAFRRDFKDSFGGSVFNATPEFLALYGLDAATYDAYDVSTQVNVPGTVRMTGVDFNYKQVLTFLPHWARGIQVFANGSAQRATGPSLGAFAGSNYIPRSGSWGVSLTREKFNLRGNWNFRGKKRNAVVAAGSSIEPGTYNWSARRLYLDVLGEYNLSRRIALFVNLRNIGAMEEDAEIYGPSTPEVAQFRQRLDHGALWTFGVKGTF